MGFKIDMICNCQYSQCRVAFKTFFNEFEIPKQYKELTDQDYARNPGFFKTWKRRKFMFSNVLFDPKSRYKSSKRSTDT